MSNTNLEIGKRYTINSTYTKPSSKYFKGVSTIPDKELRGKTLECVRLSGSGRSAWFKFRGEEFWIKRDHLSKAPTLVVRPKINLKPLTKQDYVLNKPNAVARAFWVPAMDQYVGQVVRITNPESASKWVKIDIDNGGYLWNIDWLKPAKENIMVKMGKVRKLTLQEELASIDTKYDAKIRQIKWDSKTRQGEISRKADDYKKYLNSDKTTQNIEDYIAGKKQVEKSEGKTKSWFKAPSWTKIGLWSLVGLAVIGVQYGVYWGLTTYLP